MPKGKKLEIEVISLSEFREALKARPDIIMLDNMRIGDIKKAVQIRDSLYACLPARLAAKPRAGKTGTPLIEVSGGVSLENVRAIAAAGADIISIGALTHSAKAVDISLEVTKDES